MKKYLLLFLFSAFILKNGQAQLVLDTTLTPAQLANAISGPGVTIFNVTYTGARSQSGSFVASGTNLGLGSGIMLASGSIDYAIGPNVQTSAGTDMQLPGDSTLDTLANLYSSQPVITHDAAILQFDFMAQSSSFSFRYVFGSEEYPEFVCSQYNDVFAFYITGPGFAGPTNIALIPSTAIQVGINTVNPGVTGGGPGGPTCNLGYSAYYVDNFGGPTIELDGFTVPLVASGIIQPCKIYHIKLMISDAGDGAYDSGVFIEAGSFSSNPVVNAGADVNFCSGNSASLGAPPTGTYSYSWIPSTGLSSGTVANPTVTLTNNTANPVTYTYVIIGNSGSCLFNDTVKVTVDPGPTASFTVTPQQACENQAMTVNYTGSAVSTYTWNFGNATIISGSGAGPYQISYPTAGQDSITVTATNPGCSNSVSQLVTVTPIPTATFSAPPSACEGDTIPFNFTGLANASANYNWSFGNGQIISGIGAGPYSTTFSAAGLVSIILNVSDNGCNALPETLQVNIGAIPQAIAGNDTSVCNGQPVPLGINGQAGNIYLWLPAAGLDDPTVANPTATILNNGNTSITNNYTLEVTTALGCKSTADVALTITPSIQVDFATPSGECLNGNSFDFAVQGAYPAAAVFSWDFGTGATPQLSSAATQPGVKYNSVGIYNVILNATSGNCPMPPVNHMVEVYAEPQFDFSTNDLQACSPLLSKMGLISADSSYNYNWLISNGTTSNLAEPQFTFATPGQYDVTLTGTTSHGCSSTVTKLRYLTVYPNPSAIFTPHPSVASITAPIITFDNTSMNAQTYIWDFGDSTTSQLPSETHTYGKTGVYQVTLIAISGGGCIDSTTGFIEINDGFEFFIPNSFSPNGDGINDFFQGYGVNFKNVEMTIFDRWGKKVYQTSEYHEPWDGQMKEMVQNDVYVYKITVVDKSDEEHEYVGSVKVIR